MLLPFRPVDSNRTASTPSVSPSISGGATSVRDGCQPGLGPRAEENISSAIVLAPYRGQIILNIGATPQHRGSGQQAEVVKEVSQDPCAPTG